MAQNEVTPPVYGVRTGIIFGLLFGTFTFFQDHGVWQAIVTGVLTGTFFGLSMGIWAGRQRRRAVAALGSATPAADHRGLKRAMKDPESADPQVRAEALRFGEYQLAEFNRTKGRSILIFAVLLFLELVMALVSSPWFWLGVAVFAGFLILTLVTGSRLESALVRLRG